MSWNLLYLLDALAIFSFAISYYLTCYRKGYRIDMWHSQMFMGIVMPNMLMLPFTRSELNYPILGNDFAAVQDVLPNVFLISLLGYLGILAGGFAWRIHIGLGTRKLAAQLLDIVPQCSMMLMSSRSVLVFQALLCMALQIMMLMLYFGQNGFGFDLRAYTFAHPELRPVALIISNYSIVIASHSLARYIDTKEKVLLACTLLLSFGLLFFGARSNILSIYISILLCYLIKLRTRVSLLRIVVTASAMILVVLYLGSVRSGQYSLGTFFSLLAALLLYGNTFSDLREFAWVDAVWDHQFWMGKTYLAALMSFVPRFVSQFRDTWGMGAATATTLGFDPHEHPGVRPGSFGESYFNFGLPGVMIVGLILGIMWRYIDIYTKKNLAPQRFSMMRAFAFTNLTIVSGAIAITSNASALYVLGGIFLFTWLCLQVHRIFLIQN